MFSKTCAYGLKAILHVSLHSSCDEKIGLKEIASELEIPEHFLGKIMQNLVRHNILQSAKGPSGGYFLNESNLKIPIINVVNIIDGKNMFHKCGMGLKQCSDEHPCPIHNEFKPYRDKLRGLFEKKTIGDLSSVITAGYAFLSNV